MFHEPRRRRTSIVMRSTALSSLFLFAAVCCASYFGTLTGKSAASDLFFSEYVEGSSNNKALEIYNGTGAPVDLAAGAYSVQLFANGATTANTTLNLTGTIAAGDVYVIANSQANATILAQSDVQSGVTNYNGDDALTLRKGTTIIDSIGQVGTDPGTEWGTGLTSTLDNTIRRKSTICAGDANASDAFDPAVQWDGFANDTFDGLGAHTASCGGGSGALTATINSPNVLEGNGGTTTLDFVVTLSADAPAGGVTFDITTADGTATVANNDYVARSVTGATIAEGARTYTFTVTINGDTASEPNETFFVNVTNITGATPTSIQATGTIRNDDATAPTTTISQVQGSGLTSPVANTTVTVRGIVTLLRGNSGGGGFFIQSVAADDDANAATSEGIFIFTNGVPTVTVGDAVTVTGVVSERFQNTVITPAAGGITSTSGGNALPVAVTLTPAILNPAGTTTQLERFEGMRLRADSLTSVSPSDTFGDFYTVLTGQPRPLREPGLEASKPLPPGAPATVPRFDENPERIIVDSDGRVGGTANVVTSFVTVTNPTGVLDFAFSEYRLIPEAALALSANITARPVAARTSDEFTVGSFNIENFYPGSTFNTQRDKASLAIRNVLRTPDIIGLAEIGDINVLTQLANKINADEVAAGNPDPQYQAYLIESDNDSENDQDVGFLVRSTRVSVTSVLQAGTSETYTNPNTGQQDITFDRPPLVLRGSIAGTNNTTIPIIVVANHLRSLIDVDQDPGEGPRVRAKRKAGAEALARILQDLQTQTPTANVISVGDYNAFNFTDGYVDVIGTVKGDPAPASQVTLPTSDFVNPNYYNALESLPREEQYSFIFGGNAQSLDHTLLNTVARSRFLRMAYGRFDADFPEAFRSDATRPERVSDHDASVAYFSLEPAVALTPAGDTWVQGAEAARNTNFGADPTMQVKRTLNPGSGRGRRGFLRFDTSSVTGTISSAKLRIFARLTDASLPPTAMIVQKVTDTTWNELTMTWNNQPLTAFPAALAQITVSGTTGQYYEFDLTSFIQTERAEGRAAVSFRLINQQATGNSGLFYTVVNTKEADSGRPQLVLQP